MRVLIADDQALVSAGFASLLEAARDIEVVGETTRRLTADGDGTRVLILITFGLDDYVYDALTAGASGFMLKDAPPTERTPAGGRRAHVA